MHFLRPPMPATHADGQHLRNHFRSAIFAGCDDYHQQVALLHKQVDEALSVLSGLQQPDHPESEAHATQCEEDRKEDLALLAMLAHDILAALGLRAEGLTGA